MSDKQKLDDGSHVDLFRPFIASTKTGQQFLISQTPDYRTFTLLDGSEVRQLISVELRGPNGEAIERLGDKAYRVACPFSHEWLMLVSTDAHAP